MATKEFCDGCDDEIRTDNRRRKVCIEDPRKDVTLMSGVFDLCVPCSRRYDEITDPKKWVRAARATPKTAA